MSDTIKLDYITRLVNEQLDDTGDSLELKNKFIGDEGLEVLCQLERLSEVENLDLSRNHLTHKMPVLTATQHLTTFADFAVKNLRHFAAQPADCRP